MIIHLPSMSDFDPAMFRLGDIVELQLSFIAYPVRDKYRMKSVLRSLALLDNTHSEVHALLFTHPNLGDTNMFSECTDCNYSSAYELSSHASSGNVI
jgi:hypothetical protein